MSYMNDLIRDKLSLLFGNYEVNENSKRLYDEVLSSLISACEQHKGKGLTDFEIVDLPLNHWGILRRLLASTHIKEICLQRLDTGMK
jgi:hypothetical protein